MTLGNSVKIKIPVRRYAHMLPTQNNDAQVSKKYANKVKSIKVDISQLVSSDHVGRTQNKSKMLKLYVRINCNFTQHEHNYFLAKMIP